MCGLKVTRRTCPHQRVSGATRRAQHDWMVAAEEAAVRASMAAARESLATAWSESMPSEVLSKPSDKH